MYWGGATFWLLADIEILEETHGLLGAQEALRAINRKSGGNGVIWSVDQMLAAGDEATGTHVMSRLYAKMKTAPAPADMAALFRDLDVGERDGRIVFDDAAPLAAIRRRITEPREQPVAQGQFGHRRSVAASLVHSSHRKKDLALP